jgi:GT2 family glycosyltransferase
MISIGIIIPSYNRRLHLEVLLDQIFNQKLSNCLLSVIPVIDGSADGSIEMVRARFPDAHMIIGDGKWWFTRCLNEGTAYAIEELNVDFVLTLNDDTEIPDNYIQKLLLVYNGIEKGSLLGAVSYSKNEPSKVTFCGIKKHNPLLFKEIPYSPEEVLRDGLKTYKTNLLPTRGMLLPVQTLKQIGYFDPRLPQYGSDYEIVYRARKLGYYAYITWETYIIEYPDLTCNNNPKFSKSFLKYLKRICLDRNSSNYIWNDLYLNWKYGMKILFPLYFIIGLFMPFKVYFKKKKLFFNSRI